MQVVKVKAPGHFAAFCVAINEPFYFLNRAFYLLQWSDAKAAETFCADNGVRPRDLQGMAFSEVELVPTTSGAWQEYNPADVYAELDAIGGREYKTALEREALAAYRKELNEYGEVGCSREAFIEDYICQHS